MTPSDPNEDGFPVPPIWLLILLAVPIIMIVAADRKSTRLNSSHSDRSRMPSSA